MTDEERCRLIAELEFPEYCWGWVNLIGCSRCSGDVRAHTTPPDYAHSLDATMLAARRLPEGILLNVNSKGSAVILKYAVPIHSRYGQPDDLPRHAYLVLSDYLASREGK